MLRNINDKTEMAAVLTDRHFSGFQCNEGWPKVVWLKRDDDRKDVWAVKLRSKTPHLLFRIYGWLWDKWLQRGLPFDEFIFIKDNDRYYYAEIYFTEPCNSRLRISVKYHNKKENGYEKD